MGQLGILRFMSYWCVYALFSAVVPWSGSSDLWWTRLYILVVRLISGLLFFHEMDSCHINFRIYTMCFAYYLLLWALFITQRAFLLARRPVSSLLCTYGFVRSAALVGASCFWLAFSGFLPLPYLVLVFFLCTAYWCFPRAAFFLLGLFFCPPFFITPHHLLTRCFSSVFLAYF